MKEKESKQYKGYEIYFNHWQEFCVSKQESKSMLTFNSAFDTEQKAKDFIDYLEKSVMKSEEELEAIARKFRR